MRRRRFLNGIAGLAACGMVAPALARHRRLRIGIVGGGIVGASIALYLAEDGADVVLFETTAPASGATRNSFAWLNAFVDDQHYRALRLRSLAAYHALDAPLGLGIVWGGYLNWASNSAEADIVRANAAQLAGTPVPARMLTAVEFNELDPAIEPGPIAAALYSAIDGHVDPVRATERFLERARQRGARTIYPCEVQGLRFRNGRLRAALTSDGAVPVDRLVVAAGVDAPRLLAMAGCTLQLRHAPGFLAHSRPLGPLTTRVCDGPRNLVFKQMTDGRLVGGDAPEPPDLPVHAGIRESAIDFPDEGVRALHGGRVLDKIAAFLPGARPVALDSVTLGFRPMPLDGLPVVGAVPGAADVYVAVTHSGVTLAPLLGEYVRAELLREQSVLALAPYRPGRFAAGTSPAR